MPIKHPCELIFDPAHRPEHDVQVNPALVVPLVTGLPNAVAHFGANAVRTSDFGPSVKLEFRSSVDVEIEVRLWISQARGPGSTQGHSHDIGVLPIFARGGQARLGNFGVVDCFHARLFSQGWRAAIQLDHPLSMNFATRIKGTAGLGMSKSSELSLLKP
jgi:hypothetical protein